jgi:hypothetical protein
MARIKDRSSAVQTGTGERPSFLLRAAPCRLFQSGQHGSTFGVVAGWQADLLLRDDLGYCNPHCWETVRRPVTQRRDIPQNPICLPRRSCLRVIDATISPRALGPLSTRSRARRCSGTCTASRFPDPPIYRILSGVNDLLSQRREMGNDSVRRMPLSHRPRVSLVFR